MYRVWKYDLSMGMQRFYTQSKPNTITGSGARHGVKQAPKSEGFPFKTMIVWTERRKLLALRVISIGRYSLNAKRETEGSILNSSESSGTTYDDSVMESEEQPQAYKCRNWNFI